MSKPLDKCVVDRSKWLRGELMKSYLLRRDDGKKCCVGFYALQVCGLSEGDIEQKRTLYLADPYHFRGVNTVCSVQGIYTTNDDAALTDSRREAKLSSLFREHLNCELTFVDGEASS